MTENQPRARAGTSGWNKPPWRGRFYPPGLPHSAELEYASARLASLELNTTFHGLPPLSNFLKWHAGTPEDFVFAVKGNKVVTHEQSLRNPARNVADFVGSGVLALREKLGPMLWQVPPSLSLDLDVVEAFVAVLPHSVGEARRLIERDGGGGVEQLAPGDPERPIRHAFEARHPSFLNPAFAELLRRYDVAAVVTNAPGLPAIREITSDFVYARLHSGSDHNPDGYDESSLDRWAGLVNGWLAGEGSPDGRGRDVFVYFDNPDHEGTHSPFDAIHLQQRLDGPNARSIEGNVTIQPSLW